ncbi:amino acid kinase family protein [Actinoallomurus purpureus]|uniref:amino acid kinase family protein n=1 Tax=Actinoallomurus purpureus TaxID=478114 RepID=UPI003556503F
MEGDTIRALLEQTRACRRLRRWRGGVPVVQTGTGELRGVDGVVDNDLIAARLALRLGAERLLILTDVPAVMRGWGTTVTARAVAASS